MRQRNVLSRKDLSTAELYRLSATFNPKSELYDHRNG